MYGIALNKYSQDYYRYFRLGQACIQAQDRQVFHQMCRRTGRLERQNEMQSDRKEQTEYRTYYCQTQSRASIIIFVSDHSRKVGSSANF
jgi:hypothetical protein